MGVSILPELLLSSVKCIVRKGLTGLFRRVSLASIETMKALQGAHVKNEEAAELMPRGPITMPSGRGAESQTCTDLILMASSEDKSPNNPSNIKH